MIAICIIILAKSKLEISEDPPIYEDDLDEPLKLDLAAEAEDKQLEEEDIDEKGKTGDDDDNDDDNNGGDDDDEIVYL